ncbi:MAG: hydrogenase maturation nickel metallochaperone HypA [Syntrophomonadaceae bacterium]|nr:hydrogenase maturation nickel metallochaperone HypA [Syntrophomonadaceae bacterium]
MMHELSIIQSVVDTVRDSAEKNGLKRVNKVKLVIGKLTMALPDSLQFAFEAVIVDEMFKNAVLEIEERDVTCECNSCQHRFVVDDAYCFICPNCGHDRVDIIGGRELYIDYFEGDEDIDGTS